MKPTYSLSISLLLLLSIFSSVIGQTVTQPVLLSRPDLVRPSGDNIYLARGELRVWVIVDVDGNVSRITGVDGPGWICPSVPGVAEIHKAARDAAAKAKFVAGTSDGAGVEMGALITFDDYASTPRRVSVGAGDRVTVARTPNRSTDAKSPADAKPMDKKDEDGPPNFSANVNRPPLNSPSVYRGPVNTAATGSSSPGAGSEPPQVPSSAGILNGKAKTLASPKYPAAAKAVRASGRVTVQLVIDEKGVVLTAEPVSGHPLLRSASRFAACESSFSPTLLDGQPVKVSGVITYNFTL